MTDLMRVARPSEPAVVDVREVLESSLRLAGYEIKHRARLTRDYGDVPRVEANRGSLGQVFLNLLLNAALPRAADARLPAPLARQEPIAEAKG